MIQPSAFRHSPSDRPALAGNAVPHRQLHHAGGHDQKVSSAGGGAGRLPARQAEARNGSHAVTPRRTVGISTIRLQRDGLMQTGVCETLAPRSKRLNMPSGSCGHWDRTSSDIGGSKLDFPITSFVDRIAHVAYVAPGAARKSRGSA